jgi:type VI secretion system protein VasG
MKREKLFGRLGQTPYQALIDATALGRSARHAFVDLDHWALCLLRREDSDLSRLLQQLDGDPALLQKRLQEALARTAQAGESLRDLSPSLERSVVPALSWSQIAAPSRHVRSLHILLAWLEDEATQRWLQRLDPRGLGALTVESLLERFEAACLQWPEARETAGWDQGRGLDAASPPLDYAAPSDAPASAQTLARWATSLSEQAQNDQLDPVVGRDSELRALTDILLRRRQNNPILVGEAGVGKTAVVEALAQRIHQGEVPAGLQQAKVWALDIARLQAGAGVRGEFEQRMRSVMEAVIASEHPIILFCDEAHTLIGAGGAAGTGDAVNLIKPMLARGQLRMIAATTWSEYKQFIEPDAALTRRFQTVAVHEPDNANATAMLRVIAPRFASHHGVQIADSALTAAVALSRRYLPGRQLPDKAIGLLDTACARVSMSQSSRPADLDALQHDILRVEQALQWRANDRRLGLVQDDDTSLHAVRQSLHDQAASLTQELALQRAQVQSWLTQLAERERASAPPDQPLRWSAGSGASKPLVRPWVDAGTIADILSEWSGVPVSDLAQDDAQRMVDMELQLQTRIHGQDEALCAIVQTLKVSRAGLNEPQRPLGVLLLAGPTGTGKSHTAQALAELLFSGQRHLLQFNMNEFHEAHTVSTLKGAPPGYVGYGKGGRLTEAVRQNPYSVLLLDEFDRAHRDVHEMFLQVFDQGWMEDGEGRHINFRNCLILLTSNLAEAEIEAACAATPGIPQAQLQALVRERLQRHFAPALLGRIQLVAFRPLTLPALTGIAEQALAEVGQRVGANGLVWQVEPAVAPWIAQAVARHPASGRAVRDLLRQHVLPVIAQNLLAARAEQRSLARVRLCVEGRLSLYFDETKEALCA